MVKIQEHIDKINEIKKHISNSKGKQKLQYIKCLHRLQKQALQCYIKNCKSNYAQLSFLIDVSFIYSSDQRCDLSFVYARIMPTASCERVGIEVSTSIPASLSMFSLRQRPS